LHKKNRGDDLLRIGIIACGDIGKNKLKKILLGVIKLCIIGEKLKESKVVIILVD
jgi:hypothetical protein